MTEPTIWPARRVGDRILCGRKVANQYDCQGEIATVGAFAAGPKPRLPSGLARDEPLVPGDVAHWRESAKARGQRERGQRPVGHGQAGQTLINKRRLTEWAEARIPFTRACPHCRCVARVTREVLSL